MHLWFSLICILNYCVPMVFFWKSLKLYVVLWFSYEMHWKYVLSHAWLVKCIESVCVLIVFLWNALKLVVLLGFLMKIIEIVCFVVFHVVFLWKYLKLYVILWFSSGMRLWLYLKAFELVVCLWFSFENHWNLVLTDGVLIKCFEIVYLCLMVFLWHALTSVVVLWMYSEIHWKLLLCYGFRMKIKDI